ncbi:APC family permease [Streptomyces sp. NPDC057301]|uniref:APC family permease n=1 Tax=Streptomyces sp. NPDC057301 TaxID=3346093 RepID=UPI00363A36A2
MTPTRSAGAGQKPQPGVGTGPPAGELGTRGLVIFYVTSLIGAGLLGVPTVTAAIAGPASLLAWAVLALASYPMARLFAEMSARHVDCSGLSALIRSGLGRHAGDTANILLVLVYMVGNPVMGIISARYFCHLTGIGDGWTMYVAAGFMTLSVAFNGMRLALGARIQQAALILLLLCLAGAVVLAVPSMSGARLTPFAPHGWSAVGTSAVIAFFSFLGWENVSAVAEEVRDPAQAFRRAIRYAVPVVGFVYVVVAGACLLVPHPPGTMVLTALLGARGGGFGAVGDFVALMIVVVATNAWVLGASRLTLAAARQGLLPAALDRVGRTGVPGRVLVTLGVGYATVLIVLGRSGVEEDRVVAVTSAVFLILYIATAIAALREGPTPAMRVSALATGTLAVLFLLFTGTALAPALLLVVCAVLVTARRRSPGRLISNEEVT